MTMLGSSSSNKAEDARIVLGILDSVERNGTQSQRTIAAELGIALGLVNSYLKRCVKKGLVKISEAPARRYFYYLTPLGFAEKSRLTVEYLSSSFGFFRQAKTDCTALIEEAHRAGRRALVLAGKSDLAEIAAICALEHGVTIVALIDSDAAPSTFLGVPVVASVGEVPQRFDSALLTDLRAPHETLAQLVQELGRDRVLVPGLLGLRPEASA